MIREISLSFFILLVVLLSLGQLQHFYLGPGIKIYFHDLVVLGWLIRLIASHQKPLVAKLPELLAKLKKDFFLELTLVVWVVIGWLIAGLNGNFDIISLAYTARLVAYLSLGGFLIFTKPFSRSLLRVGSAAIGWFVALLGFWQYLLTPDTRFLSILGWDDHYYRLISTQFDPNFTGALLVISYWLTASLKHRKWPSRFKVLELVFELIQISLLLGLALTFSRASFLAFLVGVGFVVFWKTKVKAKNLLFHMALLVFFIVLSPKPGGEGINLLRSKSVEARTNTSTSILKELKPVEFVVGKGLFNPISSSISTNDYLRPNHARQPDNILLLLLNGTGVVGLAIGGLLAAKWIKKISFTDAFLAAAFLGVVAHSMFNNTLLQPFVLLNLILAGASFKGEKTIT